MKFLEEYKNWLNEKYLHLGKNDIRMAFCDGIGTIHISIDGDEI